VYEKVDTTKPRTGVGRRITVRCLKTTSSLHPPIPLQPFGRSRGLMTQRLCWSLRKELNI
jgi:hypothetical protein